MWVGRSDSPGDVNFNLSVGRNGSVDRAGPGRFAALEELRVGRAGTRTKESTSHPLFRASLFIACNFVLPICNPSYVHIAGATHCTLAWVLRLEGVLVAHKCWLCSSGSAVPFLRALISVCPLTGVLDTRRSTARGSHLQGDTLLHNSYEATSVQLYPLRVMR